MTWFIFLIFILVFWLYFKFKRTTNHKTIIGRQVHVEYFDQNANFERIFPLTGTVSQKIKVGSQDFFVVQFHDTFVYENSEFDKIVIKERHAGHYIGAECGRD